MKEIYNNQRSILRKKNVSPKIKCFYNIYKQNADIVEFSEL